MLPFICLCGVVAFYQLTTYLETGPVLVALWVWAAATAIVGVWSVRLIRSRHTKEVLAGAIAMSLQCAMLLYLLALLDRLL